MFSFFVSWLAHVCLSVCVLSGRPANTLSLGGSLIYKALNEGQQRRRARTSLRLIVCLFTFTFLFHSLYFPPSTHVTQSMRRRGKKGTLLEIISSPCKRVFNNAKVNLATLKFPLNVADQKWKPIIAIYWFYQILFKIIHIIKLIFCPSATIVYFDDIHCQDHVF